MITYIEQVFVTWVILIIPIGVIGFYRFAVADSVIGLFLAMGWALGLAVLAIMLVWTG
jgi:hypothetical protein